MPELKPAAQHTQDYELAADIRIALAMFDEAVERCAAVAKRMPPLFVMRRGGQWISVSAKYGPAKDECPLRVGPAQVAADDGDEIGGEAGGA